MLRDTRCSGKALLSKENKCLFVFLHLVRVKAKAIILKGSGLKLFVMSSITSKKNKRLCTGRGTETKQDGVLEFREKSALKAQEGGRGELGEAGFAFHLQVK